MTWWTLQRLVTVSVRDWVYSAPPPHPPLPCPLEHPSPSHPQHQFAYEALSDGKECRREAHILWGRRQSDAKDADYTIRFGRVAKEDRPNLVSNGSCASIDSRTVETAQSIDFNLLVPNTAYRIPDGWTASASQ